MAKLPTLNDLFGGLTEAVAYYRSLFDVPADEYEIEVNLHTALMKIDPLFGEFRDYAVGEDTVRNEHIKRAVCYEANSIYKESLAVGGSAGGINEGVVASGMVTSEKMEDVTTTFAKDSDQKVTGLGDSGLMSILGLLSHDAAVLLSRYIRKTFGMGTPCQGGI